MGYGMSLFVTRFRELLATSGKKQTEVGAALGVSKQKLSNWKSGYSEPNLDDAVAIAQYFGVSVDYLLGAENEDGSKVRT